MSEIFGYLIVEKDVDISTLPYENEEYTLLPGSIAYVVGGGAYMLTPSNRWQFLDPEIQKIVLPVFKNVSSSGGGGGSSGIVVNVREDEETHDLICDKTWAEMWYAAETGSCIIVHLTSPESYVPFYGIDSYDDDDVMVYEFFIKNGDSTYGFIAEDPNDYPRWVSADPDNPPN